MTKRLTAFLLSVLLTMALIIPTLCAAAEDENAVILGDADGDGEVSILDATCIQRFLASFSVSEKFSEKAADVDGDGEVSILDATHIQRWLASFETPYAIGEPVSDDEEPTEPTEPSTETPTEAETTPSEVTGDEWKENTGTIVLSDSGITVTGSGAYVDGNTVIITEGGDWEVTGTCSDGMIYVDTGEVKDVNDKVKLRLNGMSLTNPDGPAIYFDRCKKAFITIESGTTNTVTDGASYTTTIEERTVSDVTYSIDASQAKGAIHTDDSLEVKGKGTLYVNGNYKHGIATDDDIVIENGVIIINSVKDGIHANDDITLNGKNIELNISSQADGLDSEGTMNLELVKKLTVTSTGKGIKFESDLIVNSGSYVINSGDDSVHCNGNVTINGGSFDITSGDDGIHADSTLTIEDGYVTVNRSYEGLEGTDIVINGGVIDVTASDDGINAAGGQDQSSQGGRPGQNPFNPSSSSNSSITISGGEVYVLSSGDGIDSNGSLSFNGGLVVVQGPSTGGNFAVDADGTIGFNGGTVITMCSSSAMWEDITRKTGGSVYNKSIGSVTKGSVVCVTDSIGNVLAAVESKLSGNLGILFYTSGTTLSNVKFVRGGAYSGTLNSYGYGSGGTVSGGSGYSPSTTSSGGGSGSRW